MRTSSVLVTLGPGERWDCDGAAVRRRRRRRDRMTAGRLQPGGGYRRVLGRRFDEAIGRIKDKTSVCVCWMLEKKELGRG